MLTKYKLGLAVLAVLFVSDEALGRARWLERDDRAVLLHPRRFGQENPAVIQKLSQACEGQTCGVLAGEAITPLLAAQPECSQQDMADKIIDAAQQFDDTTKTKMISLAIEYRQAEKNTPPDFTTNPPTPRNSVFCQKAPKNSELNGLVQAQDPANGDVFFDPATKASVKRGDQPNTSPFNSNNGTNTGGSNNGTDTGSTGGNNNGTEIGTNNGSAGGSAGNSGNSTALPPCESTVTVTVTATSTSATATSTATSGANNENGGGNAGSIGDFGSCSVPEIEFGVGFDSRKETSFQPVDKGSYNHGSAQGFDIIAQFICDTLTNKCNADQTAKDTCIKAQDAGNAATAKTGLQADAFNALFGKTTNFAQVQAIDDQGNPVPNTGAGNGNGAGNNGNAGNSTDTNNGNANNSTDTNNGNGAGNGNADNNSTDTNNGNANTGNNTDTGGNLQSFPEALGEISAPAVTATGNGEFKVEGNDSFKDLKSAVVRSCDVQNNKCANAANASNNKGDLTVANCNAQQKRCIAAAPQ